jgi:hypothetical protein
MMEAARTPETLVNFYQTIWRYNPEDSHLHFIHSVQIIYKKPDTVKNVVQMSPTNFEHIVLAQFS